MLEQCHGRVAPSIPITRTTEVSQKLPIERGEQCPQYQDPLYVTVSKTIKEGRNKVGGYPIELHL